jgi:hypothetical protein
VRPVSYNGLSAGCCCHGTYRVPAGRFVTSLVSSPQNALARPKSEILGLRSESRRTLLGLRSRWMMRSRDSSWRYSRPRAIPRMIAYLLLQSSA